MRVCTRCILYMLCLLYVSGVLCCVVLLFASCASWMLCVVCNACVCVLRAVFTSYDVCVCACVCAVYCDRALCCVLCVTSELNIGRATCCVRVSCVVCI